MAKRRAGKGFVLFSTMLLVLVLGMILRVAILRMPSMLHSSTQAQGQELALRAAESGLEYAISQLRENPGWKGGDAAVETVVNQPEIGMVVRQNQGNVLGDLVDPSGALSQFRLRFNYQDGSGRGDERDDPSAPFLFDFPYVSVNNLIGEAEAVVPRGTGPNFSVTDPDKGPYETPEKSVCLIVEGRALRGDGSVVARRVVETIYNYAPYRAVNDAAVMAAGGLKVNTSNKGQVYMGGAMVKNSSDAKIALRSKEDLVVTKADGTSGRIAVQKGARGLLRLPDGTDPEATMNEKLVTTGVEKPTDDFYNVTWDQTMATKSNAYRIPAGVYVYSKKWGSSDPKEREIRYYDMTFQEYKEKANTLTESDGVLVDPEMKSVRLDKEPIVGVRVGSVTRPSLQFEPSQMTYTAGGKNLSVPGFNLAVREHDLKVVPSARGTKGIAIVSRAPSKFDPEDTETDVVDPYNQDFMKVSLTNAKMSVEGEVLLQAGIVSKGGTLVSDQDVRILAGRSMTLETKARSTTEVLQDLENQDLSGLIPEEEVESGGGGGGGGDDEEKENSALHLNLYTKGDLRVSTFAGNGKGYRNLAFKGLIYTWGDTRISAGKDSDTAGRGTFTLKGAMVAYGGDPATGKPGSEMVGDRKKGRVNITANRVNLYWDPRFLPTLGDLSTNASQFLLDRSSTAYPTP